MRRVASVTGALFLAGVSGVVGTAASGLFAGSQSATPASTESSGTSPAPKLSVDSVVVSPTECTTTASCGPEDVDITIRNTGNADADITLARIAVQQFKGLGAMSFPTGVIIAKDGTYGVQMPSQTSVTLHEDVPSPADGIPIARFDLEFLPPSVSFVSYYVNLYRIGISLVYNTNATMPPIEVLIAVPRDPPFADKCSATDPQLCGFLEHPGCRDSVMVQLDAQYGGALADPCR